MQFYKKLFLSLLFLLVVAPIYTADIKLTVTGFGDNKANAILDAQRNALRYSYGEFISSDITVLNNELKKNEIVNLVSGTIKNFKVLSSTDVFYANEKFIEVLLEVETSQEDLIAFSKSIGVDASISGSLFGAQVKLQKINAKKTLNTEEQIAWKRIINRFRSCCQIAQGHDVGLLIDAEEYNMQIAVDQLVLELMKEFNTSKAVVHNTVQLYLVDGNHRLQQMHKLAIKKGFFLGLKLVRGAYMEKERKNAYNHGLSSPIYASKAKTDKSFNAAMHYCIKHLANIAVVLGSHNEESMIKAIEIMERHEIAHNDHRVWFSQLLGMSDHISFTLTNKGYNVVKFVPFGPMDKLIPYLARRAEENTSIAGQTSRELLRLRRELKRRILANER